jgi:NADH dehydrogenase
VRLNEKVVGVDATGIEVEDPDGGRTYLPAMTKIWAAGVAASPLGAMLARQSEAEVDRAGRVQVGDDLTLPGHPEVFVVGDMSGRPGLPGVAQVAIQGGKYAAKQIKRDAAGKGAQAQALHVLRQGQHGHHLPLPGGGSRGQPPHLRLLAWMMWLAVHLVYLIGFKNRITTLLHWLVTFVGRGRSERVFTLQQIVGRLAMADDAARMTSDGRLAKQVGIDRSRLTSVTVPGDAQQRDDVPQSVPERSAAVEQETPAT